MARHRKTSMTTGRCTTATLPFSVLRRGAKPPNTPASRFHTTSDSPWPSQTWEGLTRILAYTGTGGRRDHSTTYGRLPDASDEQRTAVLREPSPPDFPEG